MKNTLFVIPSRNNTPSQFCILDGETIKIVPTRPNDAPFKAISAAPVKAAFIKAYVEGREKGESVAFAKKGAVELWDIYLNESINSLKVLILTFAKQ